MNAAIAQHLNIAESAIVRVEEWAHVLFVVCKKIGARFVSKKVVKTEMVIETETREYDGGYNFPEIEPWTEDVPVLQVGDIVICSGWDEPVRGVVQKVWQETTGKFCYLADMEVAVPGGGLYRLFPHRVISVTRGKEVWSKNA